MANAITSWFNNALGSNITHLANAKDQDVWAILESKEMHISTAEIQAIVKVVQGKVNISNTARLSWTKIPARGFHKWRRDNSTDYVTVMTVGGEDAELIVKDYKILANRSFIIAKDGGFHEQKYGCNNLFEDWTGRVH